MDQLTSAWVDPHERGAASSRGHDQGLSLGISCGGQQVNLDAAPRLLGKAPLDIRGGRNQSLPGNGTAGNIHSHDLASAGRQQRHLSSAPQLQLLARCWRNGQHGLILANHRRSTSPLRRGWIQIGHHILGQCGGPVDQRVLATEAPLHGCVRVAGNISGPLQNGGRASLRLSGRGHRLPPRLRENCIPEEQSLTSLRHRLLPQPDQVFSGHQSQRMILRHHQGLTIPVSRNPRCSMCSPKALRLVSRAQAQPGGIQE
mmetsp:Transcript_40293/g.96619  ORF Transcript_40293/g.96619 Transcript_40293/m.96619 type:complete len:258 (+) Transcript_40293:1263-2036(+)